jgi:hypothetical protein
MAASRRCTSSRATPSWCPEVRDAIMSVRSRLRSARSTVTSVGSAIAATMALVAGATPAAAQPAPWEPERLTAGWTFTPAMVFGVLRDSNVTLRNEGAPRLTEWVGLLNPRGELDFNGRRTRFSGGYSGSLETYRRFDELNRFEQRGRLELRHTLRPRVNFGARATYSVSPTTDRLEVDALPFVDVGSRSFNAGANVDARLSPRASFGARYGYQQMDFDRETPEGSPLRLLSGGRAHSPGASFGYVLGRRVSAEAAWSYTHADIDEIRGQFDVQSIVGGLAYRVGENTSVSAGAGAAYLHVGRTGDSVWGPAVRGGVEHQAGRTSLSARYERSYVPSFGFGGLAGNQRLSFAARTPFASGRAYAGGSLSYGRSEPVESFGDGFRTRSLWVNGSVGYQMASWLRAEGFITSMNQTTDVQGDIDRIRVGVQFVTSKPLRMQ